MDFAKRIDVAEVNELPLNQFNGTIYVISTHEQYLEIVPKLRRIKVLGFDTETRPAFKKGVHNKVSLLQLSTQNEAFLIRVNKVGLPTEIKTILANPAIIKVGAAIRDDIKSLVEIETFDPQGFVDLQDEVKKLDFESFSLKKMTAIVLGFRISKSQQLSNWEAEELDEKQARYAATDAWVSLRIYEKLQNNTH